MNVLSRLAFAGMLLASGLGCGGDTRPRIVPVTGTVLLDGQPLEGAAISFIPESSSPKGYARPSMATTDQSGQFTPETYQPGDGLPVGKFKMIVRKQQYLTMQGQVIPESSEAPLPKTYQLRWIVPKMYSLAETTPLTVEVTSSGMNPSQLQLQSPPQGVETEQVNR